MRALHKIPAVVLLSFAVACGGGGAKTEATAAKKAPPPDEDSEPEERQAEEKPASSKTTYAKAALTPVKGTKLKPTLVSFTQRDDEDASVEVDAFNGIKPGTYWLVVHDGTACGVNASKAGPVWPGLVDNMRVVIGRDLTGGLEATEVKLPLDADAGAIGHVLVLHDDKKGKPGKALACGVIEEVDEL
ncbi:MAG: hypothetical protein H0T89_17150 [Deltaproteobacteria bacterium]|nr:hypothetical protein [Deltaproteobacteria bacterium]MDQ3294968.1 superoxide dismutase family protein [Myxococcota bacterium]